MLQQIQYYYYANNHFMQILLLGSHTYKTRGVVVLHCLGVAKSLQDWVGLEELGLQFTLGMRETCLGAERDTGLSDKFLAAIAFAMAV